MSNPQITRLRSQIQQALGYTLPLDDEVLGYLAEVANTSKPKEVMELIGDFCPRLPVDDRALLMEQLQDSSRGDAQERVWVPTLHNSNRTHEATTIREAVGLPPGGRETPQARDMMADKMLEQLLQEGEEPDIALSSGQGQAGRSAKKNKKAFRRLQIDYTVGQNTTPAALGMAASSSLADALRSRRQGQQRMGPMQPESFGPSASRSSWAPTAAPQDGQAMTWAERTQLAAAQSQAAAAAAPEARGRPPGTIGLKIVTSTGTDYQVHVEPSGTLGDVKAQLQKQHGIPFNRQRLLHLGREHPDARVVREAGLQEGATLQLALRPAPAPVRPAANPHAPLPQGTVSAPPQEEELILRLRLPGGHAARVDGLPGSATVTMLKQRVQVEHGIRADHVAFSFFGRPLTDGARLADCGVASNAIIDVSLSPPRQGAAAPPPPPPAAATNVDFNKARRNKNQESDGFAGLQMSSAGRVLTEDEAMELALAASRDDVVIQEPKARPGGFASSSETDLQGSLAESADVEFAADEEDLPTTDPHLEATDFHVDVTLQDPKLQQLIGHARRLASSLYTEDYIAKVSKRSGYRLTLLAERGKKVKTVLAYVVYRFRGQAQCLNVLQLGIADEQRFPGAMRHVVKWVLQFARKANCELVMMARPPQGAAVLQKFNFKRALGKTMDGEEDSPNTVCLECRLRKPSGKAAKSIQRPDFSPPPPYVRSQANTASSSISPVVPAKRSRAELVARLFQLCDVNKDDRLDEQEMLTFGKETGFNGTEEEWAQEFAALCAENNRTPQIGVDFGLLSRLIDDESDAGCHCSDAELAGIVARLEEAAAAAAPQWTEGQRERYDLVQAIFRLCDLDSDGTLNEEEMRRFAKETGFDGSPEEWHTEYAALCQENSRTLQSGVDVGLLMQLVDDESDAGCHCTDDELRTMKSRLEASAPPRTAPTPQTTALAVRPTEVGRSSSAAEPAPSSERSSLTHRLFHLFDFDGDGVLNSKEMKRFAVYTGFDGSDEEWQSEYEIICTESGRAPHHGIDEPLLRRLLDDESDSGCHLTDEEIRAFFPKLEAEAAQAHPPAQSVKEPQPMSRTELIRAVFLAADGDGDGYLRSQEMMEFAMVTGFEGSPQEWEAEYAMLCEEQGIEPARGVDLTLLERLVNDMSDSGCYCNDTELKTMLDVFRAKTTASHAPLALEAGPPMSGPTALPIIVRPPTNPKVTAESIAPPGNAQVSTDVARPQPTQPMQTAPWQQLPQPPPQPHPQPQQQLQLQPPAKLQPPALPDSEQPQWLCITLPNPAPAPAPPQDERTELARELFRCCDANGDGRLTQEEMHRFAQFTGFDGSDAEWAEEYSLLCGEQHLDPAVGVSEEIFLYLINDTSDVGQYCTDNEIRDIITRLGQTVPKQPPRAAANIHPAKAAAVAQRQAAKAAPPPPQFSQAPQPPTANTAAPAALMVPLKAFEPEALAAASSASAKAGPTHPQSSRADLAKAVFTACDADGDQRLSEQEMRVFAGKIGFEGSDNEWSEEFRSLCSELGRTVEDGVDLEMFMSLVNDQTDDGCYCSNDELKEMVRQLFPAVKARSAANTVPTPASAPPAAPTPAAPSSATAASSAPAASASETMGQATSTRDGLMRAVFEALDQDGDLRLNSLEMLRFASMVGFEGTHQDWEKEFVWLFEGKADSPAMGVSLELFQELVNDVSDNGCYCSDPELGQIHSVLAKEARNILVNDLFCKLDVDNDGMLTTAELRSFAADLPNTEQVSQYCNQMDRGKPQEPSVRRDTFARLVEDCPTEQLKRILLRLREEACERASVSNFQRPTGALAPPPGLAAPPGLEPPAHHAP